MTSGRECRAAGPLARRPRRPRRCGGCRAPPPWCAGGGRAVEALTPERLLAAQGVLLQGQRQQVRDAVHQGLVRLGEGILGSTSATPPRARWPLGPRWRHARPRIGSMVGGAEAPASAMRCPVTSNSPSCAHHVEDDRLGAVESQQVQPLERNGLADDGGKARHQLVERRGVRHEAGNRRQHSRGVRWEHGDGPQYKRLSGPRLRGDEGRVLVRHGHCHLALARRGNVPGLNDQPERISLRHARCRPTRSDAIDG